MFYLITNKKTKLSKVVTGWDYDRKQIKQIVDFYRTHKSFDIHKLA